MLKRYVVALVLSAAAMDATDAKNGALSAAHIAKIKSICRVVVGYPVATEHNLWSQLAPYVRSKSEIEHRTVDCGSQHCSSWIRLRDDAEVLYTYVHAPPAHSKIGPGDLTPDIEYNGNNRFVGVALVRRGKVIFSQGDWPKWFLHHRPNI